MLTTVECHHAMLSAMRVQLAQMEQGATDEACRDVRCECAQQAEGFKKALLIAEYYVEGRPRTQETHLPVPTYL